MNKQLTAQRSTQLFARLKQELVTEKQSRQCLQWRRNNKQIRVHSEAQKGCWVKLDVTNHDNFLATAMSSENQESPLENEELLSKDGEQGAQVMADFDSLWLSESFHFNDLSRAGLALLAQYTLKSFAYRLPGFSNCSVNYLLHNFLSMSATPVSYTHLTLPTTPYV